MLWGGSRRMCCRKRSTGRSGRPRIRKLVIFNRRGIKKKLGSFITRICRRELGWGRFTVSRISGEERKKPWGKYVTNSASLNSPSPRPIVAVASSCGHLIFVILATLLSLRTCGPPFNVRDHSESLGQPTQAAALAADLPRSEMKCLPLHGLQKL
jgi:hypothetical protein